MENSPFNLINANIITLNSQESIIKDLCIQDGKIKSLKRESYITKYIDCKGATIIPGFIDSHYHLANTGKFLENLNLTNMNTPEKIINHIKNNLQQYPKNEWILGRGWDQSLWEKEAFPTSNLLDKHFTEHPIVLTRIDGHAFWVNKKARMIANYKSNQNTVYGGEVINKCIFIDNAMNQIKKSIPKPNSTDILRYIKKGLKHTVKNGITGIHDAWQDKDIINSINQLIKKNNFPIRCYGMINGNDEELLNEWFLNGKKLNERYTIRAVKAFIDGALGSRGACLFDEYCDDPGNYGLLLLSKKQFEKLARNCYQYKFQLCTHAIGDKGNKFVLDTYEKFLKGKNNYRWRIEHAQMVRDQEISQFIENDVLPSMQPSHCTSDMRWLDKRIGSKRCKQISRWNTFIDSGAIIPGGSDCPIEKGNPILEFFSAVTRKDPKKPNSEGWQNQEKVSRINALKMLTKWGAYGGFSENRRGQIKIGYDADFTVLSQDIINCKEEDILKTEVLMTIVNGEIVYKK